MRHALVAFADHCQRAPLTKRPTVWVQFIDVWGQPQGEIGIPDPDDVAQTCFAVLTPWAMIPTIGEAWLIYDTLETLEVTRLHVNTHGIFDPHWTVEYHMDDDGALVFGWETPQPAPTPMRSAVAAAKRTRHAQTLWEHEHTIETLVPVVQGLLSQ